MFVSLGKQLATYPAQNNWRILHDPHSSLNIDKQFTYRIATNDRHTSTNKIFNRLNIYIRGTEGLIYLRTHI